MGLILNSTCINFLHLYRMRQKIEPKPENSAIPSKKLKLFELFAIFLQKLEFFRSFSGFQHRA